MKNFIMLILSMLYTHATFAQNNQIKGKIIDKEYKTPLVGANVIINNTKRVVTNNNGEFTIDCKDSIRIKIAYVGYQSFHKTYNCSKSNTLEIEMQTSAQELGTVEVTATSNFNKSPLEQPRSIVKLDRIELKRATGLYLDDAINTNVPGVIMQRRTQGAGQQLVIRGYGNGMGNKGVTSNFDGQGTKTYLNGIPITDAEGVTVMDDIDFASINSTEILKGPSGSLYGLAIAGVLNLKTEQAPKNKTSISQEVMAGSYGLLRSTTKLSIGGEKSSLLVSYGRQQFDGFMPHTNIKKDYVNLIGDYKLSNKQSITTYLAIVNSNDNRNGELTIEQYDTLDYSGNPSYVKNNAHSAVKTFRAGIGHTYRFNQYISNTSTLFGSSQNIDQSSAGGWTDKFSLNYGFRTVFENNFQLSNSISLTGITGIEAQKMNAQTIGYGMATDSTNPTGYNTITSIKSNQATTNSTYNYFTQWTLTLPMNFSLTAGVGVSNMSIQLDDRLWGLTNNKPGNNVLKTYNNQYNNLVSPNISINKTFNNAVSLYATYSVGYKAPVSGNILISTTGELNTSLKPEKGTQIELGTKGNLLSNKLFYTIAVFNTKYENKFTAVTVQNPANTATLYSYLVNGGRLNNNGLEILLNYKVISSNTSFIKLIQPFANFTYSDFKYENYQFQKVGKSSTKKDSTFTEDYSGKAVAGVAPIMFNAGIDIDTKIGLYGNIFYNYRSSFPFTSDGINTTKPYNILNGKIGFRDVYKHFEYEIFLGANNITGSQYYNMVFVNQLPDAYIPAPNEINFYGGINLKYKL